MSDYLRQRREHIEAGRPRTEKKWKRPNPVSAKRAAQNEQYKIRRVEFLKTRKRCEAGLPGCTKAAVEIHHRRGRVGKNFLDEATWLPVCRSCHRTIELNPAAAKAAGLSENRLDCAKMPPKAV